jgi:hypothetical protein
MSAERALSRERVVDAGLPSFIRKILDADILGLAKRQKAEEREMEFSVAYDEGEELRMQYDSGASISRSGEVFSEFKNRVIKEKRILFEDPRMIMDVSNEAFGKIVTDREIPYVCQETENHNHPDRSAETTVFATTEKNLRIRTKMEKDKDAFYKEVIYPSLVAQRTRQVDLLRGRETTPAEINDLDRKAGYAAIDISANYPVTVRKIQLLSPAEAKKFTGGGLPSYNVIKDDYLANRY